MNAGYDPAYGARPLRKLVEKVVMTEVSKLLLGGQGVGDNSLITIGGVVGGGNQLQFTIETMQSAPPSRHSPPPGGGAGAADDPGSDGGGAGEGEGEGTYEARVHKSERSVGASRASKKPTRSELAELKKQQRTTSM